LQSARHVAAVAELGSLGIVHPMSNLPPETRALRQMIYLGLLSFVLGFVAVLAIIGWLVAHFVAPDGRWWDILHASVNAILISFFGGLCFAAATTTVLSRVHYRRGVHRCPYCSKPLKGIGISCDCPEIQRLFGHDHDA
jgi:cytochrome c biogenesis protein CcdA